MKRNKDKINSKYRIRWFGSVTEVKPGTATIGNFHRLRWFGSVWFGSGTLFTPNKFWHRNKKALYAKGLI